MLLMGALVRKRRRVPHEAIKQAARQPQKGAGLISLRQGLRAVALPPCSPVPAHRTGTAPVPARVTVCTTRPRQKSEPASLQRKRRPRRPGGDPGLGTVTGPAGRGTRPRQEGHHRGLRRSSQITASWWVTGYRMHGPRGSNSGRVVASGGFLADARELRAPESDGEAVSPARRR